MTTDLTQAKGVYVIATTPFTPEGAVDYASMDRLIDFYVEAGCSGITILGIMGEAQKLEAAESVEIAQRFISRAQGLPIVVGVSSPGFAAMKALSSQVMDMGAAGVMIAPPNTLRTDDQITGYFANAAETIGHHVPFVLQDYPLTLNVVMTPEVIRRIVEAQSNCVMLKHEDWPGLDKITALRGFTEAGRMRPISILCGNGGLFLDFETERGADGAMTGYAFPDMLCETVSLSAAGEREAAHDLFDAHLPLIRYEQQPGIGLAVRKYVLMRRGLLASDTLRAPGATLGPKARAEVDFLLERVGRKDARAKV